VLRLCSLLLLINKIYPHNSAYIRAKSTANNMMPIFDVWQPPCNSSPGQHQNRQCGPSTLVGQHQDRRPAAIPSQWALIRKSQARQERIRHRPKGRIGTYRTPGHHLSAQGGIDRAPDCSYRHICLECHGQHREPECPAKPPRNHPFGRTPATVPAVTEGTINSPPSCTHMIHVNYNQAPINEAQLDSVSHIKSPTHSISSNRTNFNFCFQCGQEEPEHECLAYMGPEESIWQRQDPIDRLPSQQQNHPITGDLLAISACRPHTPIVLPEQAQLVTSPLQPERWEQALQGHPDQRFSKIICQGIRQGFRIGFNRARGQPTSTSKNMLSASQHPEPVREYLATEVRAGRVIQLDHKPTGLIISRFVIPKRGQPGQWCLILDLSHPADHSVNDGVDRELSSLSYMLQWMRR
jgi:hypothetical protein